MQGADEGTVPESGKDAVGEGQGSARKSEMITPEELARIPDAKPGVQYRRHPVFTTYIVSSEGEIFSTTNRKRDKIFERKTFYRMKNRVIGVGYLCVKIRAGFNVQALTHRMVLETFVGPCPDGMETGHLDGTKNNNILLNLKWVTPLENAFHRIEHGTRLKGRKNPKVKLTNKQVLTIRSLCDSGGVQTQIARKFEMSNSQIGNIKHRRHWNHI